jgi:two-component system CheB/CheR fusion protein
MRTKLRSAIQRACQENAKIVVAGGRVNMATADRRAFSITVQPVVSDGET